MSLCCRSCRGSGYDPVPLDWNGTRDVGGQRADVYTCPQCGSVLGEFRQSNGLTVTRELSSDEVVGASSGVAYALGALAGAALICYLASRR